MMTKKLHKSPKNVSDLYVEINSGHIYAWEHGLKEYPDAEWNKNKLADVLPFVKLVKPRIGLIQNTVGLKIISLDRNYHDEEEIIKYGLEPLKKAQILEESEIEQVTKWYKQTQIDLNHENAFEKTFDINDKKYKLETNSKHNYRHLDLKVLK